jgi:circadian clock protein KaiC
VRSGLARKARMILDSLIQTGIEGLDSILLGGIPTMNTILVQGVAGSGKTLLGMEIIYRGITQFNQAGMIVTFETSTEKLIRDAAALGWNLQELQDQKKLQMIFSTPAVLDEEVRSTDSLLFESARTMGAKRIFIDSIGLLNRLNWEDQEGPVIRGKSYRELLQQLIMGLQREGLFTILAHEMNTGGDEPETLAAATFTADTVIQLTRIREDRRIRRGIEIIKSRGQDFDAGEHTLHIIANEGLKVFRRVQAPLRRDMAQPSSLAKRSLIGIESLDALMGGGLFDGSTTMVVGISGAGKSVLSTQILLEGADKQGTRGLLVSLDEHPAQIIRNAQTLGLNLAATIDSGLVTILFESPQELDIDSHFARIVRTIEEQKIQRLVIDGMTSYSTNAGSKLLYRDFFHALVAYSKFRLLTTFFNYENPEFLGLSSYMPDFPVSSVVDNLILLNLAEFGPMLRRFLTVVKSRGSKHESDSREYVIGPGGFTIRPREENIEASLPASSYSSILSRAPTRLRMAQTEEYQPNTRRPQ